MDGKSKHERPSQSESFDSFRGIKMINTNTGTTSPNNNGNSSTGQRNGEPRNQRDQTDAFQMRPSTARLLCQSLDPGSIGEEEEEDTSLQSESRLVQANQRFVPSAPSRTHIPGTPESARPKAKSRLNQPYKSPGKKPTPSQRYGKQQPSTPQNDYPSREPRSPPQPLTSSSKMPTFENDAEGFMGGLQVSHDENEKADWFTSLLTVFSMIIVVMTFPFSMIFCLRIVAEYERAVVLRMGRLLPGGQGTRGPGLFFVLPCIDSVRTVELRTVTFSIPPQEVLTRDSVTVAVDAVVYYRICNPAVSILNVEDAARSTRLLAQTTLRNVLGTKDLAQILMDREEMSVTMQATIDAATEAWGVKVERVEIKDVRLPVALQRAMAAEAEATREARAKVIAANGEHEASSALKEAANVIASSPMALQLRYLQTLCAISVEKNSTIIFPLPLDILYSSAAVGAKLGSSTISLDEGDPQSQRRKAMVRQWLPSLSPDHSVTPNPRALLPGMGEPDPLIPQPVPPQLPESQRRRYEAAALLTAAGTAMKATATNAATAASSLPAASVVTAKTRDSQPPPRPQLGMGHDDFDDTCSDSV
uniref:Mechanosensory protein 2 n=2 Tax=Echinococcus granulosus TaxID=6210 RepID=A0A068WH32_ECHGR|nr:mechanosensory protein 2 [Echinococcus granulosus]